MGLISMSKIDGNGEIYNFGTGKNFSINELAEMFDAAKTEYIPKRPGEAKNTLADISLAALKLGYNPSDNLQEYVLKYCKETNKELK
jgi:nucleoside-diphosphate-sugar epimerase